MSNRQLKAYMAYDRQNGPSEGAFLVFHYYAKEARKIATPDLIGWGCESLFDVVAKSVRDAPWLMKEKEKDEPHVVYPKCCNNCETWGISEIIDGLCEDCTEGQNG